MSQPFLPLHQMIQELESLKQQHQYRFLKPIDSDQARLIEYRGRTYLNFSSNNYLGLANDPRLKEASIQATEAFGTGSGASRLVTGSMQLHHELEQKLAQFKQTQAALLFNSGYHANLSVISALMQEGDFIFSDALNHASMIDGCRLSRAQTQIYRHCDVNHLEDLLQKTHSRVSATKMIMTDSIFSMDGDAAPLKELAVLAERYDCWLLVDEAHATGVCGPNGKGLAETLRSQSSQPRRTDFILSTFLQDRLIQMGTLGKALGSFGAYVAGSQTLVDYLINKARPLIYTTALPPGPVAAALKAIRIVESEPEIREKLWKNIHHFQNLLKNQGGAISKICSPIFPLILGDSEKALQMSDALLEKGFWVTAIRYPTIAKGSERLRVTLMATHGQEELDQLGQVVQSSLEAIDKI